MPKRLAKLDALGGLVCLHYIFTRGVGPALVNVNRSREDYFAP